MTPLCSRVVHLTEPSPLASVCSHHLNTSSSSSSFFLALPFLGDLISSTFALPFAAAFFGLTSGFVSSSSFTFLRWRGLGAGFFFDGPSSSSSSCSASDSTFGLRLRGRGFAGDDARGWSSSLLSSLTFFLGGGFERPFAAFLGFGATSESDVPLVSRFNFEFPLTFTGFAGDEARGVSSSLLDDSA